MTFLGLRTHMIPAIDLKKTRDWYIEVLGKKPYFDEPYYVGFNVGGYELGLNPDPEFPVAVAYWGVPDAQAAWDELLAAGATPAHTVVDVGGGIKVAVVRDIAGNLLGIIENPHFPNEA